MTQPAQRQSTLRFGAFEVDLPAAEVRKNGRRLRLQPLHYQLLTILLEHPREVIHREELEDRLWPGVVVGPGSLGEAIHQLRQRLGDDASNPRYIETVPKMGFKFIAELEPTSAEEAQDDAEPDNDPGSPPPPPNRWKQIGLMAAALAGAVLLGGAVQRSIAPSPGSISVRQTRKITIQPPQRLRNFHPKPDVSISPNGRYVVWADGRQGMRGQIWLQDLRDDALRAIPDTGPTNSVFWSPDSQFILFESNKQLWRAPVAGGPVTTLCAVERDLNGGAVSPDGSTVVFAVETPSRLYQVSIGGGKARPVHPDEEFAALAAQLGVAELSHFPSFLPSSTGEQVLLFSAGQGDTRMVAQDLSTREFVDLGPGVAPVYSPTGHLLYLSRDPAVWAVGFSIKDRAIQGEPFLVKAGSITPSVAEDGTLVTREFLVQQMQLTIRDRTGREVGTIGEQQPITPAPIDISSDGQRIVYMRGEGYSADLWMHDREIGIAKRLTVHPLMDYSPRWSHDGRRVAFTSNRDGQYDIFLLDTERDETPAKIAARPDREVVSDWSADGKYIIYRRNRPETRADLWYLEDVGSGEWTEHPFLESEAAEGAASFSPDGRYVAYLSDQSGAREVYVRAFPDGDHAEQISARGAKSPLWSPADGEVFYVQGQTVVAVPVVTEPKLTIGRAEELFDVTSFAGWSVFPDGRTFLFVEPVGEPPNPAIQVAFNWYEEFRERQEGAP